MVENEKLQNAVIELLATIAEYQEEIKLIQNFIAICYILA